MASIDLDCSLFFSVVLKHFTRSIDIFNFFLYIFCCYKNRRFRLNLNQKEKKPLFVDEYNANIETRQRSSALPLAWGLICVYRLFQLPEMGKI